MNRGASFISRREKYFMSLKAKIEAIVYAAEEPVTLAQLAAVLSNEVLEESAAGDANDGKREESPEAEDSSPGSGALWSESADDASAPEDVLSSGNGSATQDAVSDAISEDGEETSGGVSDVSSTGSAMPVVDEKKEARVREKRIREVIQSRLTELISDYADSDRGMEIKEIAGGYRMATKPEYHDAVRGFIKSLKPPMKLSLQALETLAVVAYKQPITSPEIGEIRGVDSNGVLGSLVARKLITTAGRKHVIGRPILYKTTKEFLLRFGLKDLAELPSMEEFEKMAGELAEAEAEAEDAAMRSSDPSLLDVEASVSGDKDEVGIEGAVDPQEEVGEGAGELTGASETQEPSK
jgi:segregation and condensation protein B